VAVSNALSSKVHLRLQLALKESRNCIFMFKIMPLHTGCLRDWASDCVVRCVYASSCIFAGRRCLKTLVDLSNVLVIGSVMTYFVYIVCKYRCCSFETFVEMFRMFVERLCFFSRNFCLVVLAVINYTTSSGCRFPRFWRHLQQLWFPLF